MNCPKCNVSIFDADFIRMNKLGEIGIFWCEKCCEKHEPELYKNQKADESKIEKDLKQIFKKH